MNNIAKKILCVAIPVIGGGSIIAGGLYVGSLLNSRSKEEQQQRVGVIIRTKYTDPNLERDCTLILPAVYAKETETKYKLVVQDNDCQCIQDNECRQCKASSLTTYIGSRIQSKHSREALENSGYAGLFDDLLKQACETIAKRENSISVQVTKTELKNSLEKLLENARETLVKPEYKVTP